MPSPLAACLNALEWGPERLAREINRLCGEGTVSSKAPYKWRKGARPRQPGVALAAAQVIGRALGRKIGVEELWPDLIGEDGPVHADDGLDTPWTQDGTRNVADTVTRRHLSMNRRKLLALAGPALTAPAIGGWLLQPAAPFRAHQGDERVSPLMLQTVARRIADLRRLDDDQGGGPTVMAMATHDLEWVLRLVSEGSYGVETGRNLHEVAAELAQLAGWLAFDAGDHGRAQHYWLIALRAAHTIDDRLLGAHILSGLGYQAVWVNNPQDALAILQAARAGIRHQQPGAVHALLASRQARAHALLRQGHAMQSCLDDADHAIAAASDTDPGWSYWITPAVLTGDAGRAWLDLGRPQRAETDLVSGLTLFGDQ
jgi:hypothetical protein